MAPIVKTQSYLFHSAEQTREFAYNFGKTLPPGSCIALNGDLGTGKTVIAKEIARGLGIAEEITSPTFTLLEEYQGNVPFYHFDLYRIDDPRELEMLFFEEYWEGNGVSVIEWASRAGDRLPDSAIIITIEYVDQNSRRLTVEYPSH
jgi:tRNA threonylcarbamoyladenosine biosynthesis protein TsaE